MSLRVWLPLNGNLENKGCSNISVTNNGATVTNSGKIGSCYSFNGSSNYIYSSYNFYNTTYSVSAWVYSTSSTATQTICCDRTAVGSGFSIFLIGGKLRIDSGGNSLMWTTNYTYPVNTWFHITVTYDGSNTRYYINGEFKEVLAQSISSSYWGNTTSIGASQANGSGYGNYLNGRLNDIRIYDHCLSVNEVKEIAQGLVLHYPLNNGGWGQENVATCTSQQYSVAASTSNYNYFWVVSQTALEPNTTYTFSAEVTVSDNIERCTIFNYTNSSNSGSIYHDFPADGKRHSWTFTTTATALGLIAYAGNSGSTANHSAIYKNIKVEKGSIATPWCPALAGDAMAKTLGLGSTTVIDCSGYGHDGTITGTLTATSDSPRYDVSTNFPASGNNFINIGTQLYGVRDEMTVSIWCKANDWTSTGKGVPFSSVESGGFGWQASSANYVFYCGTGASSNTYVSSSVPVGSLSAGWHMLTATYDGLALRTYIDGELNNTVTKYSTKTPIYYNKNSAMFISGESAGSLTAPSGSIFRGNLSDCRVYATALSADDIKTLYNTSMSVDNLGKMHAFEFVEDTSSRELMESVMYTTSYTNSVTPWSILNSYDENGEVKLSGFNSIGSPYVKVYPTGKTYYYDIICSIDAGNQFYIGWERYDANKTSRSNAACIYAIAVKPTSAVTRQRYFGTIDLSTDGVNPCDTIRLRILNQWSGSDSGTKTATIHGLSLREVTNPPQTASVRKNGQLYTDEIREYEGNGRFDKNGIADSIYFIEK